MKRLGAFTTFFTAIATLSIMAAAAAPAAQAPAIFATLNGTWNCSSQGSNGKSTSVYTFTNVNDDTIQFSGQTNSGQNAEIGRAHV